MKGLFRIGLGSLVIILMLLLSGFPSLANAEAVDDFVWAGHFGSGGEGTAVSKIRKSTNSVVATIDDVFNAKWGIAVDQDAVWVTNTLETGKVTRISKSTSSVVATITVGAFPTGIAVDQDFVWATNVNDSTVSKIRKSDNAVIAVIGVGPGPHGIAVDRDSVWVGGQDVVKRIRKSDDSVVATINTGGVVGVAVDEDSVWVTNQGSTGPVSRIAKNTNMVVASIDLASRGYGIAVDPEFVWVANPDVNTVSKIRKSDNTVVGTIDVGPLPLGVAVDQDSVWAFGGASVSEGRVSRISKSTSQVTTIFAGNGFVNVGDATGFAFDFFFGQVPFAAFDAKVEIGLGPLANDDEFEVKATFTLGAGSDGIDPLTEDVSFQVGTFSTTIPAGSFKQDKKGRFKFEGVIDGVALEAVIQPLGGDTYEFKAEGANADLTGTVNPVTVALTIGDDGGSTTVEAEFE
jgi:hypothetical protein